LGGASYCPAAKPLASNRLAVRVPEHSVSLSSVMMPR
jgi:hypothetical protein